MTFQLVFTEPDGTDVKSITALAVLLILMSIAFLVYEIGFQIAMSEMRNSLADYFDIVFRFIMFFLTIIFVFGFVNDCWCTPPWQWQIGALAVFMAFFNLILMLKGMPVLGVPINMLLIIIITFLRLLYLPLLLILSFSIPFYMVFVRDGAAVLVSLFIVCACGLAVRIYREGERGRGRETERGKGGREYILALNDF